ncbi:hypothetical protein OG21DRAFT_1507272 [Imleria badia]|nr:hypothetical protein OG21DRAFT_1507272 [Imleria badia]
MEPRAITQLTKKVYDEMDTVKESLRLKVTSITPEFLATWDITSTVGETIRQHAPVLSEVLYSAAQTELATRENSSKDCHIPCKSSSNHTTCENAVALQPLLRCAVYSLFMDERRVTNAPYFFRERTILSYEVRYEFGKLRKVFPTVPARQLDVDNIHSG